MGYVDDYRALCAASGVSGTDQEKFEAAITNLAAQSNGTTATQQFVSAYVSQAVLFGVDQENVSDFLAGHQTLFDQHQTELKEALGETWAQYSERNAGLALAGLVPPIGVGIAIGATVYLGVKHWYPGGWGGFKADMKNWMMR
jgi:hypothetical protein